MDGRCNKHQLWKCKSELNVSFLDSAADFLIYFVCFAYFPEGSQTLEMVRRGGIALFIGAWFYSCVSLVYGGTIQAVE